jgi:hypothetical protein
MSEEKTIEMVSQPGTRESIAADLRRLGIEMIYSRKLARPLSVKAQSKPAALARPKVD